MLLYLPSTECCTCSCHIYYMEESNNLTLVELAVKKHFSGTAHFENIDITTCEPV